MSLSMTVGGAIGTFEATEGQELASVLDRAFGAETEWEGVAPCRFGELTSADWHEFRQRASAELGGRNVVNLLAMKEPGRGVFLPAHVQPVTLPLGRGRQLRCASLPGLRDELAELSRLWNLPGDDEGLKALLAREDAAESPKRVFARLAMAANEAVRRDCPLWLMVGED